MQARSGPMLRGQLAQEVVRSCVTFFAWSGLTYLHCYFSGRLHGGAEK
jgi:hypothetical protein